MVRYEGPENTNGALGGSLLLDRVIGAIKKVIAELANVVTNDHVVSAVITTSDTVVTHGLGFIPVAWEIVDRQASFLIWRSGPITKTTITLKATGAVAVKLRFS